MGSNHEFVQFIAGKIGFIDVIAIDCYASKTSRDSRCQQQYSPLPCQSCRHQRPLLLILLSLLLSHHHGLLLSRYDRQFENRVLSLIEQENYKLETRDNKRDQLEHRLRINTKPKNDECECSKDCWHTYVLNAYLPQHERRLCVDNRH